MLLVHMFESNHPLLFKYTFLDGKQHSSSLSGSGFGIKINPSLNPWAGNQNKFQPSKLDEFVPKAKRSPLVKHAAHSHADSALAKSLITGGASWIFEFAIGHPVEYLKILRQTTEGKYRHLLKDIVSEKGILGIWDGFFPWGTIQAISKGSVFGWGHALTKNFLQPWVDRGKLDSKAAAMIAGGVGGGVQGFVLSPTLLLKTRVMTDPVFKNYQLSPWGNVVLASFRVGARVVRKEGVGELMKGSRTFSAKRVMDWSTRYLFSELMEDWLFRKGEVGRKLKVWESMVSSLLGGTLSTLVTLPIDVAVAQIQQASSAGQAVSLPQIFAREFQAGGWERVLSMGTRGLRARIVHVALTTMVMKSLSDMMYEMLWNPSSSESSVGEPVLMPEQSVKELPNYQQPKVSPQEVLIPQTTLQHQ
eukprot:CAMPEP_0117779788 /NCGR_PEP_ID=MMETSP0948-20121206/1827_1 /TAXON_ID=44440 /ORGANISM="Chattonella subsalsa, Strain CCMP2191" /LENGTH=417 /DNA_ID=CAMNT_0005607431 /DNA_START=200 /DNA_END=1454 /DNA_ORIENTATION=-